MLLVKVENRKGDAQIQAFPNPFKSSATIGYTLPANAKVSLKVYNQQGALVNTLVEEQQQAGTYQTIMNGQKLARGKYYLELMVDNKLVSGVIIRQ